MTSFVPQGTTELSGAPQSFAPSEPIPVQAAESGTTARLTAAADVQTAIAGQPTGSIESAFGGLWKLTSGIIDGKIKEAKEAALWDGMSRAAAGESVDELRAEQNPILTFLGQDAPAVIGAQLHHSNATVSRVMSEMYDAIPDMAGLTTEQAAGAARVRIQTALEGMDAGSRAMAEQQFVENLPKAMTAHAKARVAYVNQEYVNSALDAADAAAGAFQSTLAQVNAGTVNSDAISVAEQNLLSSLDMSVPGQTNESVQRTRAMAASRMLDNGQVSAYSRFRNSEQWNELSEVQQQELVAKEDSATRKAALENPLLGTPRGDLDLLASNLQMGVAPWMSDSEIDAYVANGNAAHAKTPEGGVGNLFNQNDAIRLRSARDAGVIARQRAAAKAADEPPPVDQALYEDLHNPGRVNLDLYKPAEIGAAADALLQTGLTIKNPKARVEFMGKFNRMMAHDPRTVPTLYKERARALGAKVQAGGLLESDDLDSLAVVGTLLTDKAYGVDAVNNITGGKAAYWQDLLSSGVDLSDKVALQAQVNLQHQKSFAQASKDDYKAAEAIVESGQSNWLTSVFGKAEYDGLIPGQSRRLVRELAERVAVYKQTTNLDDEQIIAHAQADVRKKLTVVAGVLVEADADVVARGDQFKGSVMRAVNSSTLDQKHYDNAMKVAYGRSLLSRGILTKDPTQAVDVADARDLGNGVIMVTSLISRGPLAGRRDVAYIKASDIARIYTATPVPSKANFATQYIPEQDVAYWLPKMGTPVDPMKYKPSEITQGVDGKWYKK
jgi:hypothetical protein